MPELMSPEEFIEKSAQQCPSCRSHNVKGGQAGATMLGAYQDLSCTECGASWSAIYETKLVGYEHFEEGGASAH